MVPQAPQAEAEEWREHPSGSRLLAPALPLRLCGFNQALSLSVLVLIDTARQCRATRALDGGELLAVGETGPTKHLLDVL